MPFNNFVCKHMQLTREDIIKVIREKNLSTFEQIQDETDAGSICASCVEQIEDILKEELKLRLENNK